MCRYLLIEHELDVAGKRYGSSIEIAAAPRKTVIVDCSRGAEAWCEPRGKSLARPFPTLNPGRIGAQEECGGYSRDA